MTTTATAQEEKARKLKFAALEVIETEKTYSAKLQTVVDVFITPLKQSTILDRNEIIIQFNCLEVLAKLHAEFYNLMVAHSQQQDRPIEMGAIFVEFLDNFKLYKNYLLNFDMALARRDALMTADSPQYNKKFANFINVASRDPRCNGMDLNTLLLEPVQRVPRYKMLLEQLLKYTPESNHDYDSIEQALGILATVSMQNNDAIKMRENRETITKIMMSFDAKTRINLLDNSSRLFIHSGPLQRSTRQGIKPSMFWLFSDILLFGEMRKENNNNNNNQFTIFPAISMSECLVAEENLDVENPDCAFSVVSPNESFLVWASSSRERTDWIVYLTGVVMNINKKASEKAGKALPLWKPDESVVRQTIANRSAHTAHVPMVGDKCNSCKKNFTKTLTKEMCYNCGSDVCADCSRKSFLILYVDPNKESRVCNDCFVSLSSGAGVGDLYEAVPERFLPAPSFMLANKALQSINNTQCNLCQVNYSSTRPCVYCNNCKAGVCQPCCRKKYLVSYINPDKETQLCDGCFRLFESGDGGEAFAKHMAGMSSNPSMATSVVVQTDLDNNSISSSRSNNSNNNPPAMPGYAPPATPTRTLSTRQTAITATMNSMSLSSPINSPRLSDHSNTPTSPQTNNNNRPSSIRSNSGLGLPMTSPAPPQRKPPPPPMSPPTATTATSPRVASTRVVNSPLVPTVATATATPISHSATTASTTATAPKPPPKPPAVKPPPTSTTTGLPLPAEMFAPEDVSDISLPCPPDIDPAVFESLPLDIQMDLVRGMR